MTLSLNDMANKVQLPNAKKAEKQILDMVCTKILNSIFSQLTENKEFKKFFRFYIQIEDGEIFASINQRDGMVVFLDNPEKYNSPAMYRQIEDDVSFVYFLFIIY